jgi:hypothetical protein
MCFAIPGEIPVNAKRSTFFLLSTLLFVLQGCCTMAVRNIGVETESVRRCEKVFVGADGSVAVEVDSVFHKEGPLSDGYVEKKRVIVGSQEVVRRTVARGTLRDKGTSLVQVDMVDKESDGWHMQPYLPADDGTVLDYLQRSLQSTYAANDSCCFKYGIDSKYKNVCLGPFSFQRDGNQSNKRTNTRFWYYPSQILLIPAFAFDVATAPIQLIMLGHEVGKRN